MLKLFYISIAAPAALMTPVASQAAPSKKEPLKLLFHVDHEQYSRALQMMKARGLFSSYNHSCEMQTDKSGYRCEDHVDRVIVVYYSDTENANLNAITVGATPEDTELGASIATTAERSLSPQASSIQADTAQFLALRNEIKTKMETIFVRGGSDISLTKNAMLMFMLNNAKDMVIVRVVPGNFASP